ncbi:RDD family protein [Falsiroseomonas sp. E2-1-a4]|uniref:RDD family protein n=1 Tax=Falsiroseomonas sp. E2-1-a4 TaxID=3239299 RepID=UPI003F3C8ECD
MPISNPRAFDGVLRRRLVAWAIDAALVLMLSWVVWGEAALLAVFTIGLAGGLLLLPYAMILPILYGTLSIASPLSATPGQAVMGLAVRSDVDGSAPTLGQAFTSTTLFALSWAAGALPLLAALFSFRNRALHDLFSGTLVVRSAVLAQPERTPGYAAEDG